MAIKLFLTKINNGLGQILRVYVRIRADQSSILVSPVVKEKLFNADSAKSVT
jgi:hypothetical protein